MDIPKLLVIPFLAGISAQILKVIIFTLRGNFRWSKLTAYGGMPSSHTAFVIALLTVIGLAEGVDTASFAIAAAFAAVVIFDALSLRQKLAAHSHVLNLLVKDLPDDLEAKYPPHLREHIGHTPREALAGGLYGFIVAFLLFLFLP